MRACGAIYFFIGARSRRVAFKDKGLSIGVFTQQALTPTLSQWRGRYELEFSRGPRTPLAGKRVRPFVALQRSA